MIAWTVILIIHDVIITGIALYFAYRLQDVQAENFDLLEEINDLSIPKGWIPHRDL